MFVETLQEPVAFAKVFNDGATLLHNNPLPPGTLRVSIMLVLVESAILPYPIDGAELVWEAVGQFVAWPIALIEHAPQVLNYL